MSNSLVKHSKLPQNKIFVIVFRAFAFLFSIWGILAVTGVFKNVFNPVALLTYTIQSNILVTVFFGVLLTKTLAQIFDREKRTVSGGKPYGFFPRASAFVTLAIFVTMVVFWFVLVPLRKPKISLCEYFVPDNLAVHLITPLLMFLDYIIFTERGKLKRCDPLFCIIIPVIYLSEVIPLGLTHKVRYDYIKHDSYYPYFFLDIDKIGAGVVFWVAVLILFFIAIAFIWKCIDKRLGKCKNEKH